jgi:hypothetical protein
MTLFFARVRQTQHSRTSSGSEQTTRTKHNTDRRQSRTHKNIITLYGTQLKNRNPEKYATHN